MGEYEGITEIRQNMAQKGNDEGRRDFMRRSE
jgi:hypothetical protein